MTDDNKEFDLKDPYGDELEYEYIDDDADELVDAYYETMNEDIFGQLVVNELRKARYEKSNNTSLDAPVIGNIHLWLRQADHSQAESDRAMGHFVETVWEKLRENVDVTAAMRAPIAMTENGEAVKAETIDSEVSTELQHFYECCRDLDFDDLAEKIAAGTLAKLEEKEFDTAYVYEVASIHGPYDPEVRTTISFHTRWAFV